jgi:uncharacterized protein
MFMLYHEHNADPRMRPKPIDPKQREDIIARMAVGLLQAYQYFRMQPSVHAGVRAGGPRRNSPKVGRNNLRPCGSGKKYKKCCGGEAIQ